METSRVVRQQAQVQGVGRAHGRREPNKDAWRVEGDVMVASGKEGKEGKEGRGERETVLRLMQVDSRLTSSRSAEMCTV